MEKHEQDRDFDLTGVFIQAEFSTGPTDGLTGWLSIRQGDEALSFEVDLSGYVIPDFRGQVVQLSGEPDCDDFYGIDLSDKLFSGELLEFFWGTRPGDMEGRAQAISIDWRSVTGERVGLDFYNCSGRAVMRSA